MGCDRSPGLLGPDEHWWGLHLNSKVSPAPSPWGSQHMKPREAQPWAVLGQEVREQDPKRPLASGPAGWVVTEDLRTLGLTGLPSLSYCWPPLCT